MSTSFVFNGQIVKIPGAYSTIKSDVQNPPIAQPYGNVLIIDTGSGAGYGGGGGIDGEFVSGKDAKYDFDNISGYRDFQKGGLHWLLAQPLFRPAGSNTGINGVSKVTFIKNSTTVAARINIAFDDTDASVSGQPSGSTLEIAVTDEGLIGNGVLFNDNLTKGFGWKMSAGRIDKTKFIASFYRGTYKGLDQNNLPYDGITEANSVPLLITSSPEFSNVQELINWMRIDFLFSKSFKLVSSNIIGTGDVAPEDLDYYKNWNIATGGTESYLPTLDLVLTAITDLDINFIMSDQYGANATSTANLAIMDHIVSVSKKKPELYIGGGNDINDFNSISIVAAKYLNNDSTSLVHGAIYKQSQQGLRTYNVLYHVAAMMGREAGLEPQNPITFKSLDFDGMVHTLNDSEVTQALDAGVLVTRLETTGFDIIKGINTLQNNTYLLNPNSTTHSKQLKRIIRQINKEIPVQARIDLLKQENGVNRASLSEQDVTNWAIGFLKTKQPNLILSFRNVVTTRQQDGYFINYEAEPNSEISYLFFSGSFVGI